MLVVLRECDDPLLGRKRPDYRSGMNAAKWERHLTNSRDGLSVVVNGGREYAHLQATPPCTKWEIRFSDD